jgi:hypothetical protein
VASHSGHVRTATRRPFASADISARRLLFPPPITRKELIAKRRRELFSDWLIIAGGIGLLISLFLTWDHQFSPAFLIRFGSSSQLQGVPHDPTAWQVYSTADVILALLGAALIVVALVGARTVRIGMLVIAGIALAFVLHALGSPPTNGASVFDPSLSPPGYFPNSPQAGPGITVAIASLGAAIVGLLLSFTAE